MKHIFTIVALVLALTPVGVLRSAEVPKPDKESKVVFVRRAGSTRFLGDTFQEASRDDEIDVAATNLTEWYHRLHPEKNLSRPPLDKLMLYINNMAFPLKAPIIATSSHCEDFITSDTTILRFRLERGNDEASKVAWLRLLRNPSIRPMPVTVSIGIEGGEEMPTDVKDTSQGDKRFSLQIFRRVRSIVGICWLVVSLIIFFVFSRNSDIIRDTSAPPRPVDGRYPYSLGKAQMAFWFFLVSGAYFFLWLVTGDKDTITPSILVLIGISAGTALGATLIDVDNGSKPAWKPNGLPAKRALDPALPADRAERSAAEAWLADLRTFRSNLDQSDPEYGKNRAYLDSLIGRLELPRGNFMRDVLEDGHSVSFHRFQILIWTFVLGIIFIYSVITELSMPEFSATLLTLMGISSGTYLGFKYPGAKA